MPYLLIGVILLGELTSLRSRASEDRKDRGSYLFFRGAMALGYFAGFWLSAAHALPEALSLGVWAAWVGAATTIGGTLFRVWAMRTLGAYFTRAVHVSSDQKVIEDGPYRVLRHPSYTGVGLQTLGVGISMGNVAAAAILVAGFLVGVAYRIQVEEFALAETIGDPYRAYMQRTWRLIPYVF